MYNLKYTTDRIGNLLNLGSLFDGSQRCKRHNYLSEQTLEENTLVKQIKKILASNFNYYQKFSNKCHLFKK